MADIEDDTVLSEEVNEVNPFTFFDSAVEDVRNADDLFIIPTNEEALKNVMRAAEVTAVQDLMAGYLCPVIHVNGQMLAVYTVIGSHPSFKFVGSVANDPGLPKHAFIRETKELLVLNKFGIAALPAEFVLGLTEVHRIIAWKRAPDPTGTMPGLTVVSAKTNMSLMERQITCAPLRALWGHDEAKIRYLVGEWNNISYAQDVAMALIPESLRALVSSQNMDKVLTAAFTVSYTEASSTGKVSALHPKHFLKPGQVLGHAPHHAVAILEAIHLSYRSLSQDTTGFFDRVFGPLLVLFRCNETMSIGRCGAPAMINELAPLMVRFGAVARSMEARSWSRGELEVALINSLVFDVPAFIQKVVFEKATSNEVGFKRTQVGGDRTENVRSRPKTKEPSRSSAGAAGRGGGAGGLTTHVPRASPRTPTGGPNPTGLCLGHVLFRMIQGVPGVADCTRGNGCRFSHAIAFPPSAMDKPRLTAVAGHLPVGTPKEVAFRAAIAAL